jgi:glyoxylase-like metal-dependent hydrolase (beta-lactamase superfamily II)
MRKIDHEGLTLLRLTDAAPAPADWAYAFPAHRDDADQEAQRRWAPDGTFHTAFTVHAVIGPGGVALIDAGIGPGPVAYFGGLRGRLDEELQAAGIRPEEVTAVLLTHLHLDHVGWISRAGKPCFPKARYRLPAAELDHWRRRGAEAALPHHVAAFEAHVAPLLEQGSLEGLESGQPAPGAPFLRFLPVPGHTPGHAAVVSDGEGLIVAGDAWHSPAQVERPDWGHRADRDPAAAVQARSGLARLAAERSSLVAVGHFPEASGFGTVVADAGGFRWDPIPTT